MKVQELLDVLLDKNEVPDPKTAPVTFDVVDDDGEVIFALEVNNISAWSFSSDINFHLKIIKKDERLIKEANLKPEFKEELDKIIKKSSDSD